MDEPDDADDALVDNCPTCEDETVHQVLRAADAGWTLQCLVCETIRTVPAPPQIRVRDVPLILSDGPASRTERLDLELDGTVGIDDEFDFGGNRIRVTQVEAPDGERPKRIKVRDVKTVYAVMFDTVTLHYTVNQGDITRAFQEPVEPETEVHIGSVREVQGQLLAIKTLKSDQNRTLHRGYLLARNVRRVFADLAPDKAKPGQRVKTRERGAGPWGSQGASNKDRKPRGTGSHRK